MFSKTNRAFVDNYPEPVRPGAMVLQTDKDLRILENGERIPDNALCYCEAVGGGVKWCKPGPFAGKRWKRHSLRHPSIVMAPRYVAPAIARVAPSYQCPVCGGDLVGDGYTAVYHCENVDPPLDAEPDADPIYCETEGIK